MITATVWSGHARAADAVREIARCRVDGLVEASGIVASSKDAEIYWTHNDGNDGVLFAIRSDGSLAGSAKVDEKFHDWEDIASDDAGHLYLADTGNNDRKRRKVLVYKIAEPDPKSAQKIQVQKTFKIGFPDKPFDCEGLFIRGEHAYVVSKHEDSTPPGLYRFSLTPNRKTTQLEKLFDLPITEAVTAADVSSDGKSLAVLCRGALYLFSIDGDLNQPPAAPSKRFALTSLPFEGCCFTPKGVLLIAETGEIYLAEVPG